jgi:hypothetical protein
VAKPVEFSPMNALGFIFGSSLSRRAKMLAIVILRHWGDKDHWSHYPYPGDKTLAKMMSLKDHRGRTLAAAKKELEGPEGKGIARVVHQNFNRWCIKDVMLLPQREKPVFDREEGKAAEDGEAADSDVFDAYIARRNAILDSDLDASSQLVLLAILDEHRPYRREPVVPVDVIAWKVDLSPAQVRRALAKLRGTITIASTPGKASRFCIEEVAKLECRPRSSLAGPRSSVAGPRSSLAATDGRPRSSLAGPRSSVAGDFGPPGSQFEQETSQSVQNAEAETVGEEVLRRSPEIEEVQKKIEDVPPLRSGNTSGSVGTHSRGAYPLTKIGTSSPTANPPKAPPAAGLAPRKAQVAQVPSQEPEQWIDLDRPGRAKRRVLNPEWAAWNEVREAI